MLIGEGVNLIGIVWTVDQDTHYTVTVEFYDREQYRGFHFMDPFMYDKACLSKFSLCFAYVDWKRKLTLRR